MSDFDARVSKSNSLQPRIKLHIHKFDFRIDRNKIPKEW